MIINWLHCPYLVIVVSSIFDPLFTCFDHFPVGVTGEVTSKLNVNINDNVNK